MKDKLKFLGSMVFESFVLFCVVITGCICISVAVVFPEIGITSLVAGVGMAVITNKDKIFKCKKEE